MDAMSEPDCDCLGCEAERHPEHAALLHAMAGVYPGGPNCKKAAEELIVTYEVENQDGRRS